MQGGIWGGFRGSEIENVWKSAKWLDRLAPNLAHMCGFIGNGHRLKTISSSRPKGGTWGVKNAKVRKIYQADVPIGTKFVTRLRIHVGMDIG